MGYDAAETWVKPGKRIYGATIGIAIMDRRIPRPVGCMGNPRSYVFPVIYDVVHGVNSMPSLSVAETDKFFGPLLDSCRRLVDMGAHAITTTCGYAALFQRRLAAELSVPVAVSSLCQIPTILAILGPDKRLAVLAARGTGLTPAHLEGMGLPKEMQTRLHIIGLEASETFNRVFLENSGKEALDVERQRQEIVELCRHALSQDPLIAGYVAECANFGPYSSAVQSATGLPVWDGISLANWLHMACGESR
jgi:hypothetical protein